MNSHDTYPRHSANPREGAPTAGGPEPAESGGVVGGVAEVSAVPGPSPARGSRSPSRRTSVGEPLRVQDVMTCEVIAIGHDATLQVATDQLAIHHISGMPVVRGSTVVGILSEKDIARFVFGKLGLSQFPSQVFSLFREVTAEHAGRTLRHIRELLAATTVAQVMTAPAILATPEMPVDQVARMMVDRNIHRVPVVDHGKLVGIVCRQDMVRFSAGVLASELD